VSLPYPTTERGAAPLPPTNRDAERMAEAARRLLLLGEDSWTPLLDQHIQVQLGALRARLVGIPDTSANLYKSVVDQTSTLYDAEVDATGDADLLDALQDFWPLAQQNQRYAQGLRQSLVYVGWDADVERVTYTLVPPSRVTVDVAPNNPRRVLRLWWARQRPIPGKPRELGWFWDRWSSSGEFSIWSNDRRLDMTRQFDVDASEWSGDAYPIRDEDPKRTPLIPFAWYNMQATCGDDPWTPHGQSEVVFGTLQVGLLWSAAVHGVLRASWDQRLLANGRLKGGTVEKGGDGRAVRYATPDPTAVMQIEGENVQWGAWGASIDITKAEAFCRLYEARLAVHFGLSPSDLVIESLNPASGASITVSQKGKRLLQARQTPVFRRGDRDLARITAAVLRGRGGRSKVSAVGFAVRYPGIALTPEERVQVVSYCKAEVDLGVMTRAEAWRELHPGTSVEQAEAAIKAYDMVREQERVKAAVDPLAGAGGEAVKVADTALNGAQVASAVDIVVKVAQKLLPRDAGVNMLREFQLADDAEAVMGSVGESFFAAAPPAPPPPFGGKPDADNVKPAAEEAAPEAK
jgi:hypothetical protein